MQKPAEKTTTGNDIIENWVLQPVSSSYVKSYQKVWPIYEKNVKYHVVQLPKIYVFIY